MLSFSYPYMAHWSNSGGASPSALRVAFTLLPGDVILTGTPSGVGPVTAGQRVSVEIEGIGTLDNPFVRR